jgi:hypothetical protein
MILDEDVRIGDEALEDFTAAHPSRDRASGFFAGVEIDEEAALFQMRHVARYGG